MRPLIFLALIVFTNGACVHARLDAKGKSLEGLMTPGQGRDLMADDNATKVQTLGIVTGTPTATTTEAQQMASGGAAYGYSYGVPVGPYGANVRVVPPSYYLGGVPTTSVAPSRADAPSAPSTIQPIIVPIPGSASDASAVGHLINATGHLIDLADVVIAGQDYEVDLALHRICMLTWLNDLKRCPLPLKPQSVQSE